MAFLDTVRRSGLVEDEALKTYTGGDDRAVAGRLVADGLLTQFQADLLLAGRYRDFFLHEKYKILDLLGVGGMGRVFLCEHTLLKRKVAVKMLPRDKLADKDAVARFFREARAVAALRHPNIVQIFDVEVDARGPLMVMEYIEGSTLQAAVERNGPLPIDRACHYVFQAAEGLQHAHEAGMVHRDIKPGNLLLDRDGVVRVLDLGLARFFRGPSDRLTEDLGGRSSFGTVDYLAPEQAVDATKVDIRADIYGLGCTFYYLLMGRPPYPEGTLAQKLVAHQEEPIPAIRHERPEAAGELERVLMRMLAKSAGSRYAQPAEVAAALRPWLSGPVPLPDSAELRPAHPDAATRVGDTRPARSPSAAASSAVRNASKLTTDMSREPTPAAGVGVRPGPQLGRAKWFALAALAMIAAAAGAWLAVRAFAGPGGILPEEAARRVDEVVTVRMTVESVGRARGLVFLNTRRDHTRPDNFVVVVPDRLAGAVGARTLVGDTVLVTGKVTLYKRKPQIRLDSADRLRVVP